MALIQQDMSKVEKWGDVPAEGWYRVRLEKVEVRDSDNTPGAKVLYMWLKVQNEPHVGRLIMDMPSLQAHALAKLKAYYTAANYNPGPEGHDPEKIVSSEFFVCVTHETYQGQKRAKIAPWQIKSVNEGPGGELAA